MTYLKQYGTKKTPQSEPIPGKDMVKGTAGGFVFAIDKWARLRRFLILGTEGGTYYASERDITKENIDGVIECIKEDAVRTAAMAIESSVENRAPKNDQALFVLALILAKGDYQSKVLVRDRLSEVARIGTHLFQFIAYSENFRGWGRMLREAVGKWYNDRGIDQLAYQVAKYRQRGGWSHMDALRLAHPKPRSDGHNGIFRYAVGKADGFKGLPGIIQGLEKAGQVKNSNELIDLIHAHKLTHEMIPTEYKGKPEIQRALLDYMPPHATLRSLGTMGNSGLLKKAKWDVIDKIKSKLTPESIVTKRVHPMAVLLALKTYAMGQGFRGKLQWEVVPEIVTHLDQAFYWAFDGLEPTNKRHYLGIDVSGSMSSYIMGTNLRVCEGAAAMAMTRYKIEDRVVAYGFSSGSGSYWDRNVLMKDLKITKADTLDIVSKKCLDKNFGRTDCALPMIHALKEGMEIDMFEIYTDNETWHGKMHPVQALEEYRNKTGIPARLAVFAMTATRHSIADPNDPGMLDVVGFDTSAPNIISSFARGEV